MRPLSTKTRKAMVWAWAMAFGMIALAVGPMLWLEHEFGVLLWNLLTMPAIIALLPLIGEFAPTAAAKQAERRAAWRAAYKASPASHLLKLS